jgi:hypothetical protein
MQTPETIEISARSSASIALSILQDAEVFDKCLSIAYSIALDKIALFNLDPNIDIYSIDNENNSIKSISRFLIAANGKFNSLDNFSWIPLSMVEVQSILLACNSNQYLRYKIELQDTQFKISL